MNKKIFEFEMKVRDYECDAQGIVNNANYLHYFEVTRHEFMTSLGSSFKESHALGVDPVVSRADLHYKTPLIGNDLFVSSLTVERKGIKIIFYQTINRKNDGALCCKATIEIAVIVNGILSRGDYYDNLMTEYL
ncbi:MAG: acyl-CoA thioesterase [Dysgonamonadaceae bacterium]|jgi:acyl-CoA thioester hydrolase|nr:acyl-CoA thioesterase [Dysgonamonadaceae bacterium]